MSKKKEVEEIEFEKLPNSTVFVMWKTNLKGEFFPSSSFWTEAMVWINKVTSALKMMLAADFKRRVYIKEQKIRHDNRLFKGRHIAYMIYGYFKISGTDVALLDFNDRSRVWRMIMRKTLISSGTKYSFHDKSFRWRYIGKFVQKQLHYSEELKIFMTVYLHVTKQKGESTSHARLKQMFRQYLKQKIRYNNFDVRNKDIHLQDASN